MEEPPLPHRVEPVEMPPNSDWVNLERDTNPLPGRVDDVYQCGYFFRMVARDLGKAADDLTRAKNSSDGSWQGKTAGAFRDKIGDAPTKLGELRDRFFKIAVALEGFAPGLAAAQASGKAALVDARDQQRPAMRTAAREAGVDEMYYVHPPLFAPPPPTEADKQAALKRLETASDAYRGDVGKLAAAEQSRDDAANRCAGDLDAAGQDALTDPDQSGLPIFRFLKQAMQVINNVANWVGCIAGLAALVCAIIPPLQVLAPIFGAIALIAGIVSLVTDIGLMSTGQKDWNAGQIALDVIGILPFGKLAKMFGTLKFVKLGMVGKMMTNLENGRLLFNDSEWLPSLFKRMPGQTMAQLRREVSASFTGQLLYRMEKLFPELKGNFLKETYLDPMTTLVNAVRGELPKVEPFDALVFKGDLFQNVIGNMFNAPPGAPWPHN